MHFFALSLHSQECVLLPPYHASAIVCAHDVRVIIPITHRLRVFTWFTVELGAKKSAHDVWSSSKHMCVIISVCIIHITLAKNKTCSLGNNFTMTLLDFVKTHHVLSARNILQRLFCLLSAISSVWVQSGKNEKTWKRTYSTIYVVDMVKLRIFAHLCLQHSMVYTIVGDRVLRDTSASLMELLAACAMRCAGQNVLLWGLCAATSREILSLRSWFPVAHGDKGAPVSLDQY